MTRLHPDCPCCTCGQIQLTWSDRECWVFPEDLGSVAEAIVNCALDHSYDRPRGGAPDGITRTQRAAVEPVIARDLSAVEPDWEHKTVEMTEDQRLLFVRDVKAALEALETEKEAT